MILFCFAVPLALNSTSIGVALFQTRLYFSWSAIPCGSRNGDITGYKYELREGDTNNGRVVFGPSTIQVLIADIISLSCGTTYRFGVAGINSAGTGPYSYKTASTSCCTRGNDNNN